MAPATQAMVIAGLLRNLDGIEGDVEPDLDRDGRQCSIGATCRDLGVMEHR